MCVSLGGPSGLRAQPLPATPGTPPWVEAPPAGLTEGALRSFFTALRRGPQEQRDRLLPAALAGLGHPVHGPRWERTLQILMPFPGAASDERWGKWAVTETSTSALSRAFRAVTRTRCCETAARQVWERWRLREAEASPSFPDRFRMAMAAGRGPEDHDIAAWLRQVAAGADEWMLRASAITSLARLEGPAPVNEPVFMAALGDPAPRVRAAALTAIARPPESGRPAPSILDALGRSENDRWPTVRLAAYQGFARLRDTDGVRRGLRDTSREVRRRLLLFLRENPMPAISDAVRGLIVDPTEAVAVREAALHLVGAACMTPLLRDVQAVYEQEGTEQPTRVGREAGWALYRLGSSEVRLRMRFLPERCAPEGAAAGENDGAVTGP